MNLKTWAPLGLAAVLGLAAAMVAKNVISQRNAQAPSSQGTLRSIVVANTNILPGTELDSGMLIEAKVSQEMAPEDTFSQMGELDKRVTQGPIYKGQPIIAALLAPKGSAGGLQALVPEGMRAITIQVDEFQAVGGFLTPGCRVDVLATMQGERNGDMISRTVVQNIMITAVGARMTLQKQDKEERVSQSVTMIATPEEAQSIELAAATSRPRLVLRNVKDASTDMPAIVSLLDFKSGHKLADKPADPFAHVEPKSLDTHPVEKAPELVAQGPSPSPFDNAAAQPRTWTVKIIRAGSESQVELPLPAEPAPAPAANEHGDPITQTENKQLGN